MGDSSFLEEQLKRIREMSQQVSSVKPLEPWQPRRRHDDRNRADDKQPRARAAEAPRRRTR